MADGSDGTAFVLGVGAFSATIGAAISQGLPWFVSTSSATITGVLSGSLVYWIKNRMDRKSNRRENHRKFIYTTALVPAFNAVQIRPVLGLARIISEVDRDESSIYPALPDTNTWRWLLVHEPEISRAVTKLVQAKHALEALILRSASEAGSKLAPPEWAELTDRPLHRSINRRRYGYGILRAAAAPQHNFWSVSTHSAGNEPAGTLMLDQFNVAQGPLDTIQALSDMDRLRGAALPYMSELNAAWDALHAAHRDLLLLLERKAATGTIDGKCAECP